jgi:CRP-like cAMP-binding protein
MAKGTTPTRSIEVLDKMVQTLRLHSRISAKDERTIRQMRPRVTTVAKNTDIVRQGDRPHVAVMVLRGMLARYHTTPNGDRQYLSLHLPGDLPDLQSVFLGIMDHSLCALADSDIALFRHEGCLVGFKQATTAGFAFWRQTLIDAAIFRQAITNNGSRGTTARLAHLLCEQYARALVVGLASQNACKFPLTQTQIGQVLGLSLITVNRATQELRREGCADIRGGELKILNWRRLKQKAGFDPTYLHFDLNSSAKSFEI